MGMLNGPANVDEQFQPIGRRQFVLGKFVGIILPVALLFLVLGAIFLATVSYKVVYDARESALPDPTWQDCYREMIGVVPGLVLAFMEVIVLTSISVAISTRLPMLANLIICASIYVLGHMVPMLVKAARTKELASYSLGNMLLTNAGNLVHSVYVYALPPGPIWLLHAFYLVTTGFMLAMYLRHEALGRKRSQGSTHATAGKMQDSPESGPSSEFQHSPQLGSNSP